MSKQETQRKIKEAIDILQSLIGVPGVNMIVVGNYERGDGSTSHFYGATGEKRKIAAEMMYQSYKHPAVAEITEATIDARRHDEAEAEVVDFFRGFHRAI